MAGREWRSPIYERAVRQVRVGRARDGALVPLRALRRALLGAALHGAGGAAVRGAARALRGARALGRAVPGRRAAGRAARHAARRAAARGAAARRAAARAAQAAAAARARRPPRHRGRPLPPLHTVRAVRDRLLLHTDLRRLFPSLHALCA